MLVLQYQFYQTVSYTYDNNGNNLTKKVTDYINGVVQAEVVKLSNTYDEFNQLTQSITDAGITVSNTYNGEGYRVQKSVQQNETTAITKYFYEGNKVISEYDAKGNQKALNIYGLNLLTRIGISSTYNYMYNGHADVTALINSSTGTIDATYYYDAFGNILIKTGNVDNSIRYAGYQYDEETGLYYLNSRMYDPVTARFVQEDTYRGNPKDPLSLNLYAYCANNPLIYTDPTGHHYFSKYRREQRRKRRQQRRNARRKRRQQRRNARRKRRQQRRNARSKKRQQRRIRRRTSSCKSFLSNSNSKAKVNNKTQNCQKSKFIQEEKNVGVKFSKDVLTAAGNTVIGKGISKLKDVKYGYKDIYINSKNIPVRLETSRSIRSVKALKGVSKSLGVLSAVVTVHEVGTDIREHDNWSDRAKAVSLTALSVGIAVGAAPVLTAMGASAAVATGLGFAIGFGAGVLIDKWKERI